MASSSISDAGRPNSTEEKDSVSSGHVHWFLFQGTDEAQPVSRLSPFIIDKALRAATGELKTVKRLQKGDILLEASTSVQSRCLSHLKDLGVLPGFGHLSHGPLILPKELSVAVILLTMINKKYFLNYTAKQGLPQRGGWRQTVSNLGQGGKASPLAFPI